jgi:hypothetical protein
MLRAVKTMPRTIFTLRFAESLKVTDRNAITNGTHNQSANTTNMTGPAASISDIIISNPPGSIKIIADSANRTPTIKIHSTESLIL